MNILSRNYSKGWVCAMLCLTLNSHPKVARALLSLMAFVLPGLGFHVNLTVLEIPLIGTVPKPV